MPVLRFAVVELPELLAFFTAATRSALDFWELLRMDAPFDLVPPERAALLLEVAVRLWPVFFLFVSLIIISPFILCHCHNAGIKHNLIPWIPDSPAICLGISKT